MGNKSNILTLRTRNEGLNLNTFNMYEVLNSEDFIKILKRSFDKKGVIITAHTNTTSGNSTFLLLDVFYKTAKLTKLRKKVKNSSILRKQINIKRIVKKNITLKKKGKNKKLFLRKNKIRKNYKRFITILKKCLNSKLFVLKFNVINNKENSILKNNILNKLKKFKRSLFSRRANLYYDFIKLTSLFINKNINVQAYCNILSTAFKFLPKHSHGKFFLFLKTLLNLLVKAETTKILGTKVLINGKIKGKLRASSFKISVGKISTQTISSKNYLSKVHINTLYGAFGMTMWVNYIKTKDEEEADFKKSKEFKKISYAAKKKNIKNKIKTFKVIKNIKLKKTKSIGIINKKINVEVKNISKNQTKTTPIIKTKSDKKIILVSNAVTKLNFVTKKEAFFDKKQKTILLKKDNKIKTENNKNAKKKVKVSKKKEDIKTSSKKPEQVKEPGSAVNKKK